MTLIYDGDNNNGNDSGRENNVNNTFGNNSTFYYIIEHCGLLIATLCVIVYLMVERRNDVVTGCNQAYAIN